MESFILEEWKELRAEINRKQSFSERILVITGGANFAIIAYGIKDCAIEGVAVCVLPTIITSVAYLWLVTYIYSGFRIAAYIKQELEPKIKDINWENWLTSNSSSLKFPIRNKYALLAGTLYFISFSSAVLKISLLSMANQLPVSGFLLAVIVFFLWALWIGCIHFIFINRCFKAIRDMHRAVNGD